MADISALGELKPVETLDLSDANYKDAGEAAPLPKAGRYTVRAPESFPKEAFGRTKAGALSAQVDPTIVGPSNEGYKIRFAKVSAKTFKRQGATVSQLGDYLRATGFRGRLTNEAEQVDAVTRTAGALYQVDVDWRAYNKTTGYTVEGMERFPSDGNGGHQSWITDPGAKDDNGQPVRLRANLTITRFVPING